MRTLFATGAALLLALIFFARPAPRALAQTLDCGDEHGGLLQDCGFTDFYGDEGAGSGVWKIFNLSDSGGLALHPADAWPKGPALWVKGGAPFDVGVYQQVKVTPGKGYHFSLPYAVVDLNGAGWTPDNQVNRRLGIDPFGGTDAASPNVKWSSDYFGKAKVTESIDFDEYARADTITVYIRVTNPYTDKEVDVFIDSPSLIENTSMPPIQVGAAPTALPAATVTPPPSPVPPTAPATREPTAEPTVGPPAEATTQVAPTDMPTEEPTVTPSDTPTARPRATRTQVALAQVTARPTRARVAASTAVPVQGPVVNPLELGIAGVFGLVGIAGAVFLAGAAAFLVLRRK